MNMCIIMGMNIYITPQNEKLLRQEHSMSGLINMLLEGHYAQHPPGITHTIDKAIEDYAQKQRVGKNDE